MKIVILQGAFLPVPTKLGGAVEKMWFELGKKFAADGHEVLQISRTFDKLPDTEIIDGVQHVRVKGYATPSSGIYLKVLDLLYTRRAIKKIPADTDVIVTNTFWGPILISNKLKSRCFIDVARMPKGQMKFYTKAGVLRANSTPVETAIKNELPPVHHPKVVMIPNPLTFIPGKEQVHKQPIFMYAGRVHPEKGLDLLVQAFRQLNTFWQLKIVGPWDTAAGGGGMEYLSKLKELAGNDTRIHFTGPEYNTQKLNAYYQKASVFVYPSVAEQGETFGLAPLEAMAWGCVPVVSNLACFQDFIVQDKNGLIFNHRSASAIHLLAGCMQKLQDNEPLRTRIGELALHVRQSHSVEHIGNQFLGAFQRMQ